MRAHAPGGAAAVGGAGSRALRAEHTEAPLEICTRPDHINLLVTDIAMPGQTDGFSLVGEALACRLRCKTPLTPRFPDTKQGVTACEVLGEESLAVPSASPASQR